MTRNVSWLEFQTRASEAFILEAFKWRRTAEPWSPEFGGHIRCCAADVVVRRWDFFC